jgi:hypothetical protein
MRVMRSGGVAAATVAFAMTTAATAGVTTDRPAAIVKFPIVAVVEDRLDTVIQISNTSRTAAVNLHCFYVNANAHCTNTGDLCFSAEECCTGPTCGICEPGWNEIDFRVRITPGQPIGWRVSQGLDGDEFPLDGVSLRGPDGSSNANSRVPPAPETPFVGELKCIAVDSSGDPIDDNVLIGNATLEQSVTTGGRIADVAKYNAVGIQAIEGAVNQDNTLVLGGDGAEYNGCPNVTIVNHFAEFTQDPATEAPCTPEGSGCIETALVLVPCAQDLLRQLPGSAVVQYLVYNEFEQRFSTSRTVRCQQVLPLSLIDTTQRQRSIFSAGVLGTTVAQTRLTPIGSGVVAVAFESHGVITPLQVGGGQGALDDIAARRNTASFNVHYQGDRPDSDLVVLP